MSENNLFTLDRLIPYAQGAMLPTASILNPAPTTAKKPRPAKKRAPPSISVKKRSWTKEEDEKLKGIVHSMWSESMELPKWSAVADAMGDDSRSGKQCRERWNQHLRPGLVKGNWTKEEDDLIDKLQQEMGTCWSKMKESLPHRTDNDIKNRWYARHKRRRSSISDSNPRPKKKPASRKKSVGGKTKRKKSITAKASVPPKHPYEDKDREVDGQMLENPIVPNALESEVESIGFEALASMIKTPETEEDPVCISSEGTGKASTLTFGLPTEKDSSSPYIWPPEPTWTFGVAPVRTPVVPLEAFTCTPIPFNNAIISHLM